MRGQGDLSLLPLVGRDVPFKWTAKLHTLLAGTSRTDRPGPVSAGAVCAGRAHVTCTEVSLPGHSSGKRLLGVPSACWEPEPLPVSSLLPFAVDSLACCPSGPAALPFSPAGLEGRGLRAGGAALGCGRTPPTSQRAGLQFLPHRHQLPVQWVLGCLQIPRPEQQEEGARLLHLAPKAWPPRGSVAMPVPSPRSFSQPKPAGCLPWYPATHRCRVVAKAPGTLGNPVSRRSCLRR